MIERVVERLIWKFKKNYAFENAVNRYKILLYYKNDIYFPGKNI